MSDQPLKTTTMESSEASPEQAKESSAKVPAAPSNKQSPQLVDKDPGWELRLFIRALLAQNLQDLLKSTGHTQSELQLYTGLSKQTIYSVCSYGEKKDKKNIKEKKELSELNKSAFKSNTFVFTVCWYVDNFISALDFNDLKRNEIVSKLVDRNSDKYIELSDFLQSKGLTLEQIEEYADLLYSPKPYDVFGHQCSKFHKLWTESFEDFAAEITRELKGLNFKDAVFGTFGADSFDFTTASNVYFDLVFLQHTDLGDDVFMRPLLQCLIKQKVCCLFDLEQFNNLKILVDDSWDVSLHEIIRFKDDLSAPNTDGYNVNKVDLANKQLQFITLHSKLLRNLAILHKLGLVPCRKAADSCQTDLLLSQMFAAKGYLEQASQLIKYIISGLSKRRKINLASAVSFLKSLDETKGNPYYIFTADANYYWPFNINNIESDTKLVLRSNSDALDLFSTAKEKGLVLNKELHVLVHKINPRVVNLTSSDSSSLVLAKPLNKVQPERFDNLKQISLFQNKLDTYYCEKSVAVAKSFEVDKTRGGATLLTKLKLDDSLKNFLDQLPDAYYGTVLVKSIMLLYSGKSEQELVKDTVAALDKFLQRGGFEG